MEGSVRKTCIIAQRAQRILSRSEELGWKASSSTLPKRQTTSRPIKEYMCCRSSTPSSFLYCMIRRSPVYDLRNSTSASVRMCRWRGKGFRGGVSRSASDEEDAIVSRGMGRAAQCTYAQRNTTRLVYEYVLIYRLCKLEKAREEFRGDGAEKSIGAFRLVICPHKTLGPPSNWGCEDEDR